MLGSSRTQCGAVILETAITFMVLFVLLLGILEVGIAFKTYQAMTNAAREGARFSVAADPSNGYAVPTASAVQVFVSKFLGAANVQGTSVTVDCVYASTPSPNLTVCPAGATAAQDSSLPPESNENPVYTRVQVSIPAYKFVFFPFTVHLQTKAVMRNENSED
jgi:Flp pilus assembly protein TadG